LCIFYSLGIGVEKNEEKSKELFEEFLFSATSSGEKYNHSLGVFCEHGFGGMRNLGLAFNFYAEGAEKDDVLCSFSTATFFEEGDLDLVPIDSEDMIDCYKTAADQGHSQAQFKLCQIYTQGFNDIAPDLTKASDYFKILSVEEHEFDKNEAEKGVRHGNIGCCYRDGLGVEKNPEMALQYFHKAAELGHASAQFKLCVHYGQLEGNGSEKCQHYFNLLSDSFHPEVHYRIKERYKNISYCYAQGLGVPQDLEKASHYEKLHNETGERFLFKTWI
jgi:uncharacterized protein